ncbi:MAG TPA: transposase [Balneolaceae bacterium]|nr:transposase [Balneolaceae bacterium]
MSKIQTKQRQSKLSSFVHQLGAALPKPERRCLAELIFGLCKCRQPILRQIALAIRDHIPLRKTVARFRRPLRKADWWQRIFARLMPTLGRRLQPTDYRVLDLADIQKPTAPTLAGLADVRDGDTGDIGPGYWWLNVLGISADGTRVLPVVSKLSSFVQGPQSENQELLAAVDQVAPPVPDAVTWVVDRGGDRGRLIRPWLTAHRSFIIRLQRSRHLVYAGSKRAVVALADRVPLTETCRTRVVQQHRRVTKTYRGGAIPVRLPHPTQPEAVLEAPLWLVVLANEAGGQSYFLVHTALTDPAAVVRHTFRGYGHRWPIEEYHRHVKEQFHLETIQVQKWAHLQNLVAVLTVAMAYLYAALDAWHQRLLVDSGVPILEKYRLHELLGFCYYKVAEVVRWFFEGSTIRMFPPATMTPASPPRQLQFAGFIEKSGGC